MGRSIKGLFHVKSSGLRVLVLGDRVHYEYHPLGPVEKVLEQGLTVAWAGGEIFCVGPNSGLPEYMKSNSLADEKDGNAPS